MVNAKQYLDNNYPESERWEIQKLDLSNKNLEGNLDLTDFFSLREIRINNNPQLGEITNKPWGAISYFSAQEWLIRKHSQQTTKKIKLEHGEQIEGELIIDSFSQLEEIEFWRSDLIKLQIKKLPAVNRIKLRKRKTC